MEIRACLKKAFRELRVPVCGIFYLHSVDVARYAALIQAKSPTNCDAHLAESLFQTRSRLFLLYFPGYYDGDEIIGIYDNISKLKASYERVIDNAADEYGFRKYNYYLANSDIKLTIEEFDRDKEIFVEVDPELLWLELDDKE